MLNFNYYTPTRYVFGRGVEMQAGNLTREMGCRNVLLVYGMGSVVRSGLLDRVKGCVRGVRYRFYGFWRHKAQSY